MPGNLIYYALVLIVIALVAALLGFGGVASTAMRGAHLLIWVAVIVLVIGVVGGPKPPTQGGGAPTKSAARKAPGQSK